MDPSKKLFEYAKKGQFEKIESLMEKYPNLDLNTQNNEGDTPLHLAAGEGYDKTCEVLIKSGAKMNTQNHYGNNTPLHSAALWGFDKTCEILIKDGAKVNTSDNDGETPLHWAARWGRDKTCEVLIKAGAKVNISDKRGNTPLNDAVNEGHDKICQLLIKSGAKITTNIFEQLTEKWKKLIVLYENEVDPKLTELKFKIKKRKEEKKKLLNNYFPPGLFNSILNY